MSSEKASIHERRPSRPTIPKSAGVFLEWPGRPQVGTITTKTPTKSPLQNWISQTPPGLAINGPADASLAQLSNSVAGNIFLGKIQLCYLDPPFNTGENFVHYNDGRSRIEWLAMLRNALLEIRPFLAPEGSIWLHLDDSEQHHGRNLLDEVFGADSFVSTVVWQRRTSRDSRKAFSNSHDYIHVYSPGGPKRWKMVRNTVPDTGDYSNPDKDPRGPWRSTPLTVQDGHATKSQFYTITSPSGVEHNPPPGRCWIYNAEKFINLNEDGKIYWPRNGAGKPRLKKYAFESSGLAPTTIWPASEVGDNAEAKRELRRNFPNIVTFDTPKPERLMQRIIEISTNPGDLIMDPFAGSGTTAAVASQLGRGWVTIEVDQRVFKTFTLPRLQRHQP